MTSLWLNTISGPYKTLGKEPSESKEALDAKMSPQTSGSTLVVASERGSSFQVSARIRQM